MALEIRYLGWVAFQFITEQGTLIVMDPMLSGSGTDGIAPSPVSMEQLYGADLVIVTHAAADHVGQAFEILEHSSALLVCDVATRLLAIENGLPGERIYHMLSGVEYQFNDVSVKALAARHVSLVRTRQGFVTGQPLSYVIGTSAGERIFFGGDTSIHRDLELYGALYQPHIAILGVGGVDVHGQSLSLLSPKEAALAAGWLGVRMAIPVHYRFGEAEQFVAELGAQFPDVAGLPMKPGERFTFRLDEKP